MDSSIRNKRIKASDLARRSSDIFCEKYGYSALDSIAPFERDEIILGLRVGTGSFSSVYEIQAFQLRPDQSKLYTEEQIKKRDATAKSMMNGSATYVLKRLKEEVEESDDEDLFLDAAHDIVHEAEMLAALSHPNIVQLHGVIASRHDAFFDGASEFFLILERLDSTLTETIEGWKKENAYKSSSRLKSLSTNLSSSSLKSLSGFSSSSSLKSLSYSSCSRALDKVESLDNRIRVAVSLAGAVEYLHSQGVIFHDLKPDNVGFKEGNLRLFDFGLARLMPQRRHAYDDVYELSGAGTPRYTAPEIFFDRPYNLKADVYSFSVMLWEMMMLKKPFGKCKRRKDFEKVMLGVDKALVINRKWPQPIQVIIMRSLSRDISERPTMSEVCKALSDSKVVEDYDLERNKVSTQKQRSNSLARRASFASFSTSCTSVPTTADTIQDCLEESEQPITF